MFRTKKSKKAAGAGGARKRPRGLEEEAEGVGDGPTEVTASASASVPAVDADVSSAPVVTSVLADPREHDGREVPVVDAEDEEAVLERMMRHRAHRSGRNKAASALSFASKSSSIQRRRVVSTVADIGEGNDDAEDVPMTEDAAGSAAVGCLSFDDEEGARGKTSRAGRKIKIRPNLSVGVQDEGAETAPTHTANRYSADVLAELMREQNVLLRPSAAPANAYRAVEEHAMDVEMEATELSPTAPVDEETNGNSDDEGSEEFIPLNSKLMRERKRKKRVTFGVHDDGQHVSKSAEVQEPSDDEDEDGDQSKRWEEELMRRGGLHPQHSTTATQQKSRGSSIHYPTRRKVPCGSLPDVLRRIQRRRDQATIELDRTHREVARLDAESALIRAKLEEHNGQLLTASEEYEYFQEIEDFVKGLSFCLREKLPAIEDQERGVELKLSAQMKNILELRERDINDECRLCISGDAIREGHFFGLRPEGILSLADDCNQKEALNSRLDRFVHGYPTPDGIVNQEKQDMFSDAVEGMSSLRAVYGRFQEWKSKFPEIYANAYCDLASAKLYSPYVQAELLYWDPLSIAKVVPGSGTCSNFDTMDWFNIIKQHSPSAVREEPVVSIVRDVIIARFAEAIRTRFDPYSSTQTQSVALLVEAFVRHDLLKHVEHPVEKLIESVLGKIVNASKTLPLLALNGQEAVIERARVFGSFLLGEYCLLIENALGLFVSLPKGTLHQRGFNSVMQLLHQLLAYLNHCQRLDKLALVPEATQTIKQLSASTFMQSVLSRSMREQQEFARLLEHFRPFCP